MSLQSSYLNCVLKIFVVENSALKNIFRTKIANAHLYIFRTTQETEGIVSKAKDGLDILEKHSEAVLFFIFWRAFWGVSENILE